MARNMSLLINNKQYVEAEQLDDTLFVLLNTEAGMAINFNNINQPPFYQDLANLEVKVNKFVKPTLNEVRQSLDWKWFSMDAYFSLKDNFVVPSEKFLEALLDSTELKIAVYNGNLDAVTPLAGATNWVHALKWKGRKEFTSAKRIPIKGYKNGFYKEFGQLSFWTVFGSGHWVPEDNPIAMEHILEYMTEETNNFVPTF